MEKSLGLFSHQYFGPISSFSDIAKHKKIVFSSDENFQKQSYHNRCVIAAANGELNLIIPIHHSGARSMELIEISYEEDWLKNHLKSLASAYRRSPYFEYYEDRLVDLYTKKPKLLKDFLFSSTSLVFDLLKIEVEISANILENQEFVDFRRKYHPKQREKFVCDPYIQVFSSNKNFINDMCILDLLFNLGPESISYLSKLNFH